MAGKERYHFLVCPQREKEHYLTDDCEKEEKGLK